ncbi:MAG: ABC transporter ATP-binding protein [Candidatus Methanomethylophilaceae archaeon]|nr:ABC transporter ATP-binding protein [Candidatus Methanomethylophilaceae archaeon]
MMLKVENLVQGYGSNTVLDGISFEVNTGEIVALLGPNGSGKSTIIKTVCDIMAPKSGSITIDGREVHDFDSSELAKVVSYVPQSSAAAVYTTVMDTVLVGRRPYIGWSYKNEDIEIAIDSMRKMNIESLSDKNVSELSGGQKQRVFLARSLAQDPDFFIFDEPTSALDLKFQMKTMISMRRIIKENGAGMLIALHDINLALNYTDKVIMIKDGKVLAFGDPKTTVTVDTIREVYGVDTEIIETKNGRYILPISPCDGEGGGF